MQRVLPLLLVLTTLLLATCNPLEHACQAAALRQAGISVTTHVVGFALTEQQTTQVRCIAEQGGDSSLAPTTPSS